MVVMSEESEKFMREHFENAEELLKAEDVNDVLDVLYDWIDDWGFAENQDGYNDDGRTAQRVYDDVYYSNT